MRGLTDRKPDLGNDEIHQLRTAVVNGIADSEHRDFPHYITRTKGFEGEVCKVLLLIVFFISFFKYSIKTITNGYLKTKQQHNLHTEYCLFVCLFVCLNFLY